MKIEMTLEEADALFTAVHEGIKAIEEFEGRPAAEKLKRKLKDIISRLDEEPVTPAKPTANPSCKICKGKGEYDGGNMGNGLDPCPACS